MNACTPCLTDAHPLCTAPCDCADKEHKPVTIENDTEAAFYLQALERYHKQPINLIKNYCKGLMDWATAKSQSPDERIKAEGDTALRAFALIGKSNLLSRLLYDKQQLRTVPCPIHKGKWSGCVWGMDICPAGCNDGANVTGWLPNDDDLMAKAYQVFPHEESFTNTTTTP